MQLHERRVALALPFLCPCIALVLRRVPVSHLLLTGLTAAIEHKAGIVAAFPLSSPVSTLAVRVLYYYLSRVRSKMKQQREEEWNAEP